MRILHESPHLTLTVNLFQMSSIESDVEVGFDEEEADFVNDEEEDSDLSDGENFRSGKIIRGKGLIWSDPVCDSSDSPLSFPSYEKYYRRC